MAGSLNWEEQGRFWPLRAASRFVTTPDGLRWHVQVLGAGPPLLLVHGTGASSHSFRGLAELLSQRYTVVVPDLPGHAFSDSLPMARMTLPGMAEALAMLLDSLAVQPAIVAGHSAGAAIVARMCLDGRLAPDRLVSLNGAFLPFRGVAGPVFSSLAQSFARSWMAPRLFAMHAAINPYAVHRLLADTGSAVDDTSRRIYAMLARTPAHVSAALQMMAGWELEPLLAALPKLRPDLVLIVGTGDRTIDPRQAQTVHGLVPGSRVIQLPGLGHLAHEERPNLVAAQLGA